MFALSVVVVAVGFAVYAVLVIPACNCAVLIWDSFMGYPSLLPHSSQSWSSLTRRSYMYHRKISSSYYKKKSEC